MILPLLASGCHLVSRAKNNAVAYHPATMKSKGGRGRKKLYGKKEKLAMMFEKPEDMTHATSPIYGEKGMMLRYASAKLLWRPVGVMVQFVAVLHPIRGKCLLICTDTTIPSLEVIRFYGLRFKIEVSFKQSIHTIGAYLYHFWMAAMSPVRRGSGDQHLHRKTEEYRKAVRRKIEAYHRFMQVGLVAQGIMAAISTSVPHVVWKSFGSWLRTIRPDICPSEMVVSIAMKNSFPQFLTDENTNPILAKFIIERMDFSRNNRRTVGVKPMI